MISGMSWLNLNHDGNWRQVRVLTKQKCRYHRSGDLRDVWLEQLELVRIAELMRMGTDVFYRAACAGKTGRSEFC